MGNKGKMKQLIREIEKVRWISTKDGFKALLEKNNLPISPAFLNEKINTFIKEKENKPKGTSLLWLRKRINCTMVNKNGKIEPYRIEEALERFIVASNDEVFNQIPVGGGKENVDLGYWENNAKEVFNFVELKAWESSDSPLYAVVESLKNLSLFRLIQDDEKISCRDREKLKNGEDVLDVHKVKKIKLIILAPQEYFDRYFSSNPKVKKMQVEKFLLFVKALKKEFKELVEDISCKVVDIRENQIEEKCKDKVDRKKGVGKKQEITIGTEDAIDNLKIEKWEDLE